MDEFSTFMLVSIIAILSIFLTTCKVNDGWHKEINIRGYGEYYKDESGLTDWRWLEPIESEETNE